MYCTPMAAKEAMTAVFFIPPHIRGEYQRFMVEVMKRSVVRYFEGGALPGTWLLLSESPFTDSPGRSAAPGGVKSVSGVLMIRAIPGASSATAVINSCLKALHAGWIQVSCPAGGYQTIRAGSPGNPGNRWTDSGHRWLRPGAVSSGLK